MSEGTGFIAAVRHVLFLIEYPSPASVSSLLSLASDATPKHFESRASPIDNVAIMHENRVNLARVPKSNTHGPMIRI